MNSSNKPVDRIKLGLVIAVLAVVTGCVGVVDGGYGGDVVVAPGPDLFLFGGGFDRGRDVHDYSRRGVESRAVAHPAASHAAARPSGGGRGRR